MKTLSQIEKLKLVHKRNIESFILCHGIAYPFARRITYKKHGKKYTKWIVPKRGKRVGNCIFVTMTFDKLIYSKKEAEFIKCDFVKKLKVYTPFAYCCVPEHHSSGAYHFHFLISLNDVSLTLNDLKQRIRRLKFVGFISVEWTWGPIENVSYYLTQYLTAENFDSLEGKSITYSRCVRRVANLNFSWVDTPWHRFWNVLCLCTGFRRETMSKYYNDVFCKDHKKRFFIIELFRKKQFETLRELIALDVRSSAIIPEPISHIDSRHNNFIVNQICFESMEYENKINGVPF